MAESDAREKAAKLKARARRRRKRKQQEQQLSDQTPDTDARDAAKSKRRKLQEKGKQAGKSVAGTLKSAGKSVAGTLKSTGKSVAGTLKSGASKAKQKATSGRTRNADNGGDEMPEETPSNEETRQSRAEVFRRGLSKIGQRLGSGASAFAEQANEWEPQAPDGPGSEGENDAAAIATLAGAGFGGQGDPAVLVGVDKNRDGQFQRDEIGFLGPAPEPQGQTQPQAEPQAQEPVVPGFGMGGGEPQVPMFGPSGGEQATVPDFGGGMGEQPTLPGFGTGMEPQETRRDREQRAPTLDDLFVNNGGPRF